MTETNPTTKKRTTKPKAIESSHPEASIVVLDTTSHDGFQFVIRANPTDDAVRDFVQEHTRRYATGEPGGPSGIPAHKISGATRYAAESDWRIGSEPIGVVEVADLLLP